MQLIQQTMDDGKIEEITPFQTPEALYTGLLARVRKYHPSDDISLIEKAYDDAEKAHESALRMLTARAHGEQELLRKLRQKYDAEAARSAVERCKDAGLIDDSAFAADLAESLTARKGWSPERVKTELICRSLF